MITNLLHITFSLLLMNSCSSTNADLDNAKRIKGTSDIEDANVEISQHPDSPEEGVLYAQEGSHPHEIRVKRGANFYIHYFDPDGILLKSEKSVGEKIEIINSRHP